MTTPMSYHVYRSTTNKWLADDEKTWTLKFHETASFTSYQIASMISEREDGDYVFGCMPS